MTKNSKANDDSVVLLHGIGRSYRSMQPLEKFLQAHGYRTLNLDYPSTRHSPEDIVCQIQPLIEEFSISTKGKVHFIGYSMGGLLVHRLMQRYRPPHLGHVVMLGPPHQGSEVAEKLKNFWLFKKLYGPAGQALGLQVPSPEPVDYPLGVIAGDRPLDLFSSWLIGKPNDGKVSVESTKINGMTDHITLKTDHTFMLISRQLWAHTLHFLQNGRFA